MRRWCRLLLVLVGVVVLAGCQAEVALHIDVNEDGSGIVTASVVLDPEAASRTILFETPLVDDLKATGWNVVGPTQLPDTTYQITASKSFSRAGQLHGLIEELAGPNGAFRDFQLDRATLFAKRDWTLTGTVDLTKGLASFSDDELNAQLGGPPLGPDKASQDAALGRTLESIIHVTVQARLPGTLQSHNGTAPTPPGGAPSTTTTSTAPPTSGGATTVGPSTSTSVPSAGPIIWQPSFADTAPLHLEARSNSSQLSPRLWRWLAAAAAVVGAAVLVYQLSFAGVERMREYRRARRRRVRPLPTLSQPEPELEGLGAVMAPGDVAAGDVTPAGVGVTTPVRPAPRVEAGPAPPPARGSRPRASRAQVPFESGEVPPPRRAGPPGVERPARQPPRSEPSRDDPSRSEPPRSEPSRDDPSRREPSPLGPSGRVPSQAEPPDGVPPEVVSPELAPPGTARRGVADRPPVEPAGSGVPSAESDVATTPRVSGTGRGQAASGRSSVRLLVIETAGVLFSASDPVQELLVPHVRARASTLSPAEVNERYVSRVVGGLPPGEFWAGLGILGHPMLLDDSYARRYELSPDIEEFLRQAVSRGMDVVAVGEEAPEWVGVFRQRFGLDQLISAWVTSSDVGVRPPHPALVQAALRASGQSPGSTMVIARNLRLLDGARRLGCRTVQYLPEDTAALGDHPLLRSFARAAPQRG